LKRRFAALSLGATALASLAAWSPVRAQQSSEPEPVLVELRVGRFTSRTVQAFRVRTEALLPMTQFAELVEMRFLLSPEGRFEATVDPGDRRLVIDAALDSMRYGTRRVRIEPEFRLFREGELYIGAERLGDLLEARIVVNWADLDVTLVDPVDLPIGRRLRREATRGAFLRRAALASPDLRLAPERRAWDGLVFDYSVFSPSTAPLGGASYTAALGADAFGGSLEIGATSVGPAEDGQVRMDGSWTGVWRDNPWLVQLRLGDGASTGPRPRGVRGVAVTNAPFLRSSEIGSMAYGAELGPGWSVEAYRGGDLVAFDSTDAAGGFTVALPVRYGENPVDFVAYGPFGEIREFNRTYRVIAELLPAGRFEYGASAGSCRAGSCRAAANLDLHYGAGRNWTVRAGVDGFWRDSVGDRFHPYAALVATPTNAWALELSGVGGAFARAGLRYEPSLHLRLTLDAAAYATDSGPVLFVPGRRSEWSAAGFWRPLPRAGSTFLEARVHRVRTAMGTETRDRLGGSIQAGDLRWFPFIRRERLASHPLVRNYAGLELFMLPQPSLGRALGGVWLRAGGEADAHGVARAAAFAARQFGSGVRVEIGTTWTRGTGGPTHSLVVTSYLPAFRATTAVTAPAGAPALATQFVQGSVLWDRATGAVAVAPGPSLERAGVVGHVFMDDNGNGVRDAGEAGVAGVRVRVGSGSALSDSSGLYRLWDVVPYEPVAVAVDSASLASPLLVPAFATASLVPGPNRFQALDVPIVQAGVLEGRVTRAGRGVGGVALVLTDRRTGARRAFTTFSDGEFYVLGVRTGDYELTVEPRVLERLGVHATPARFTLAPTVQGVGRSGVEVELRSKP
jgi:hypothetical protein